MSVISSSLIFTKTNSEAAVANSAAAAYISKGLEASAKEAKDKAKIDEINVLSNLITDLNRYVYSLFITMPSCIGPNGYLFHNHPEHNIFFSPTYTEDMADPVKILILFASKVLPHLIDHYRVKYANSGDSSASMIKYNASNFSDATSFSALKNVLRLCSNFEEINNRTNLAFAMRNEKATVSQFFSNCETIGNSITELIERFKRVVNEPNNHAVPTCV